jgi:hypothetical protein
MKLDTSWSRLIDSPIGKVAKLLHSLDHRRSYHNWTHICRNFHHAKETFNLEYDMALDLANLFHDAAYDEHPDKELRSAAAFTGIYSAMVSTSGFDAGLVDRVLELIADTISHKNFRDDDRMILLDLADLGDPMQCQINYGLIMDESVALYGVPKLECAKGNLGFMNGLLKIAEDNKTVSSNEDYWEKIITGINQTIRLSEGIIDVS